MTTPQKTNKDLAKTLAKKLRKSVVIGDYTYDYSKWPYYFTTSHNKFNEIFK